MRVRSLLFVSCLGLFVAALPAWAEYIQPGDVSVKVDQPKREAIPFQEGTYVYNVSWQGIPVAEATVEVDATDVDGEPYFYVAVSTKTKNPVKVFYKLYHKSESLFHEKTLLPVSFYSYQKENTKEKIRKIRFEPTGTVNAVRWKNGKLVAEHTFFSDKSTFDPISAAFFARSLPLREGAKSSFDVFNGKHRYLITFHVKSRQKKRFSGKRRDVFQVVPEVKKLTDTEGEKKLSKAVLWITADEKREVVGLDSRVVVGKVTAKLASFSPRKKSPSKKKELQAKILKTHKISDRPL